MLDYTANFIFKNLSELVFIIDCVRKKSKETVLHKSQLLHKPFLKKQTWKRKSKPGENKNRNTFCPHTPLHSAHKPKSYTAPRILTVILRVFGKNFLLL